jgi:hypothetical protein
MEFVIEIKYIFHTTLERAFKTPLLCDVTKVHTGFGIMPRVTHCTGDENWGQVGASKKVYAAKSLTQKGGFVSVDTILDRVENSYWKFEVSDFQSWMLGFTKFTGEWRTIELEKEKILVEYTYHLHANQPLLYPLNWLFAHTFWKTYMKRVLNNIKSMIAVQEPYTFS